MLFLSSRAFCHAMRSSKRVTLMTQLCLGAENTLLHVEAGHWARGTGHSPRALRIQNPPIANMDDSLGFACDIVLVRDHDDRVAAGVEIAEEVQDLAAGL